MAVKAASRRLAMTSVRIERTRMSLRGAQCEGLQREDRQGPDLARDLLALARPQRPKSLI
jgi:hypothetical protein